MPKVLKIEKDASAMMADIQVEDIHCFYANGLVVHNSTKDIGEAMQKIGMSSGKFSEKTGRMLFNKSVLAEQEHPIFQQITERNSLMTQLTNYASKFTEKPFGYVSYQTSHISTGRIASGNPGGGNEYFLNLNFQNLTKPDSIVYRAFHRSHPLFDTYLKDEKEILDYKFIPVPASEMIVKLDKEGNIIYEKDEDGNLVVNERGEYIPVLVPGLMYIDGQPVEDCMRFVKGPSQDVNIRSAVTTPNDDWLLLSIDYTSEEIVLAGIMSGEPNYLEPFRNGEDIHKRTAIAVWGEENYDDDKRSLAKKLNFGMQYGGSVYLLVNTMGIPENEADDIYKAFWKGLATLKRYQDKTIKSAYNCMGTAYTYFGRPRRFKDKLFSENFKDRKKGEREVLNHPIQGTAGDIIRLCLVQLYERYWSKPETEETLKFVGTVHDEIVMLVKKTHFYEWMPKILEIMQVRFEEHNINLKCELEVGDSFGRTFVFTPDTEGIYKPSFKKI